MEAPLLESLSLTLTSFLDFYTVTLTVSDGQHSAADSVLVTVQASEGRRRVLDTFDRPDSSILGNGWKEISGDFEIGQGEVKTAALKGTHLAVLSSLTGIVQNVAVDFASVDNNLSPRFGIVLCFHSELLCAVSTDRRH